MPSPRFVHLRFHSEYSITDGIVRIDPMIHAVLEGGGAAVGISDLMNVFGGLRFYTHALAAGLKPILGCDLKVINPKDLNKPFRLGVLCMNHEGYHSLSVLLTKAFLTNNDAARGLVDPKWFDDGGSEGLIALSGAAQGELGSRSGRLLTKQQNASKLNFRAAFMLNCSVQVVRQTNSPRLAWRTSRLRKSCQW